QGGAKPPVPGEAGGGVEEVLSVLHVHYRIPCRRGLVPGWERDQEITAVPELGAPHPAPDHQCGLPGTRHLKPDTRHLKLPGHPAIDEAAVEPERRLAAVAVDPEEGIPPYCRTR